MKSIAKKMIMEKITLLKLIRRLGSQRRLLWYHPGRYAYWLLANAIGDGRSIQSLRASTLSRLLQREDVKAVLAQCGDGILRPAQLDSLWQQDAYPLVLNLGTSRLASTTSRHSSQSRLAGPKPC